MRQNRHQPLRELGPMAYSVLSAVTRRLEQDGRLKQSSQDSYLVADGGGFLSREVELLERPPLNSLGEGVAHLALPGSKGS